MTHTPMHTVVEQLRQANENGTGNAPGAVLRIFKIKSQVFQICGRQIVFQIVSGQIVVNDRIDVGRDRLVSPPPSGCRMGSPVQDPFPFHHDLPSSYFSVIGLAFAFPVFAFPCSSGTGETSLRGWVWVRSGRFMPCFAIRSPHTLVCRPIMASYPENNAVPPTLSCSTKQKSRLIQRQLCNDRI